MADIEEVKNGEDVYRESEEEDVEEEGDDEDEVGVGAESPEEEEEVEEEEDDDEVGGAELPEEDEDEDEDGEGATDEPEEDASDQDEDDDPDDDGGVHSHVRALDVKFNVLARFLAAHAVVHEALSHNLTVVDQHVHLGVVAPYACRPNDCVVMSVNF